MTSHAKHGTSPYGLLLAGVIAGGFAPLARAELDAWMRIDGIPGESQVRGHENEIDLTSYSQTFGTRNCSRVVALKFVDRASPALIARAAANAFIPSVVITLRKAGEGQQDFFVATLESVLIERIELTEGSGQLQEQVVLKPRNIRISYRPQNADGSLGTPIITDVQCT